MTTTTLAPSQLDPLARMIADCAEIRLPAVRRPVLELAVPAPRAPHGTAAHAAPRVIDITDAALALARGMEPYGA